MRLSISFILLYVFLGSSALAQAPGASFLFATFDVPGSLGTEAFDINNRGDFTGTFTDGDGLRHGFLLRDGSFATIDFPGGELTEAVGINDAGDVVGNFFDADGRHGFLLRDGSMTTVEIPGGGIEIAGINNRDQIVGTFEVPSPPDDDSVFGFILDDAGNHTLLELGGFAGNFTQAYGINDLTQVVGHTGGILGNYLYSDGSATALDVPGTPRGINDSGQIVGSFGDAAGTHGFVFQNGRVTTIDVPGSDVTRALGINDAGQVVGHFLDVFGRPHGFVATPVPEPAGLMMLGMACLALLTRIRRG